MKIHIVIISLMIILGISFVFLSFILSRSGDDKVPLLLRSQKEEKPLQFASNIPKTANSSRETGAQVTEQEVKSGEEIEEEGEKEILTAMVDVLQSDKTSGEADAQQGKGSKRETSTQSGDKSSRSPVGWDVINGVKYEVGNEPIVRVERYIAVGRPWTEEERRYIGALLEESESPYISQERRNEINRILRDMHRRRQQEGNLVLGYGTVTTIE